MIAFIGWALVHAGWQDGIIAAVLAVALWLTRDARSSTRYVLTLAALALAVAAPIATTVATRTAIDNPSAAVTTLTAPAPRRLAAVAPREKARAASNTDYAIDPPNRAPLIERLSARVNAVLPWLVAIWVLGIALLSIRVLAGVANVRRLGRGGVSIADARVRSMAGLLAERLNIRSAVRVLQSTHVDVPMVIGWVKPAVLVPAGLLASIAPAELEMLLAHELAHIRRHDTIVNLAQTIVETLLFFHPGVWWISARVREERENCCDDLAIAVSGGERLAYGTMLLQLEESRAPETLAVAATDGSLLRRVKRIVLGAPTRVDLGASWLAGIATMLTALLIVVPNIVPAAAARPHPASTPATPRQSPPVVTPSIQQPSSSTPMPIRSRSLLAGAAALTIAATQATAQAPNFSGRWMHVADSSAESGGWVPAKDGPNDPQSVLVEHTGNVLALTADDNKESNARITFQLADPDAAGRVRVTAPVSVSINARGAQFTIDATAISQFLSAQWSNGGFGIQLSTPVNLNDVGTWTLSLDRDGNLLVDCDVPASEKHAAKHVAARFRRV